MDRKFEQEKQALVKLGVPEELAFIIVSNKQGKNKEEVEFLINDIKEQQKEIQDFLKEFKPLNENLISNSNNIDVKDKN
jgi:hypothetical protein